MTTIIGIKASSEKGGVVLGSDSQLSLLDDKESLKEKRKYFKKIIYGKTWSLGHSGTNDKDLDRFNDFMQGRRRYGSSEELVNRIIEKAVMNYDQSRNKLRESKDLFERPHFEEVNFLNTASKRHKEPDPDEKEDELPLHYFLLATSSPKMGLWYVDSHGNLREVSEFERDLDYLCLGSGSKRASAYIEELLDDDKIDPNNLTVGRAISVVTDALDKAEKDAATGGPIDLVVLTKENAVRRYGGEIKDALLNSQRQIYEKIIGYYPD